MSNSASGGEFPVRSGDVANDFVQDFISESITILSAIDRHQIQACAEGLASIRDAGGRLFVLGVGGSAGHASHAVNDFRKICGLESYTPTDNVSELTARTNDEGWDTTFENWLRTSRIGPNDGILVFSVGGGNLELRVSVNLVRALELGRERGTRIFGIVGRDGGFTARVSDACVVIPPLFDNHITPHTEGLCAVIWHLLVSHPLLAASETKWESVAESTQAPGSQGPSSFGSNFSTGIALKRDT